MPTNNTRTGGVTRSRRSGSLRSDGRMCPMNWLFKEEPTNYSDDGFRKDKAPVRSGVKNPVAQRNRHAVKKGDRIFYYPTGDEKAVVGVAKAAGDAYPDPKDKTGKFAVVDVVPVRKLKRA